jgi:hypothetical protein
MQTPTTTYVLIAFIFMMQDASALVSGDGLTGDYYFFNNSAHLDLATSGPEIDFSTANLAFSRVDSNIDYWDGNSGFRFTPIFGRGDHYGVNWHGYIRIDVPGGYGFGTVSDDGSQVFINGDLVVDNGEIQFWDWEDNINEGDSSGETFPLLNLSVGFHEINVRFYEQQVFDGIELWWFAPNVGPSNIPYDGTNFHDVALTFDPTTNWNLVPQEVLYTTPVPLPAAGWLFLSALFSLRRRLHENS